MTHDNNLAFIGLGGNLGQPRETFVRACALLEQKLGRLHARSSLYTSAPLLAPDSTENQPDYLNAVISLHTLAGPKEIVDVCLAIEKELGRIRKPNSTWEARTLDLDLLAINDLIVKEPDLTLPHAQLHLRDFVLEPLCEIAPNWRHPIIGKTAAELLENYKISSAKYIKAKQPFV